MELNDIISVKVKKILPTPTGFALFIGSEEKTFVIYLGGDVGTAILMLQQGIKSPRPLTHDLIGRIFASLEIKLDRVVISDLRDNTFFAQLHIREENELGKKVVVIDARPSDCIALAFQQSAPIYVLRKVLEQLEDVSYMLEK